MLCHEGDSSDNGGAMHVFGLLYLDATITFQTSATTGPKMSRIRLHLQ